MEEYDFVIVGGGTTGLSAAIYAARFRLKTIILAELPGGTITTTDKVENWPGLVSVSGWDLVESLKKHVEANDVPIENTHVQSIERNGKKFLLKTSSKEYSAKTVLLATGSKRRKLNVSGEKEFENKGVSYCAVCDGALFKGKDVAVIGGRDSAVKEALFLSDHAKKVYIIYRGEKLKAEPVNLERIEKANNIEVLYNKNLAEIKGSKSVEEIFFKEGGSMKIDGVFVEVGALPNSELAEQLGVKLNDKKEIVIDDSSRTSIPGLFAAGDVANRHFKQAITGAGEGVIAAFSAYECINNTSLCE